MDTVTSAVDVYRRIVDAVRDYALYFLDTEGNIMTWNSGAERLHGYTAGEIIGQHFSVLFTQEDRQAAAPKEELRIAGSETAGDASAKHYRWLVRKDGSRFWSESCCSAARDEEGALAGFTRLTRDASEMLSHQQALARADDELHRFAYIVSHDLQEPVRTVRSYAELLSRRYRGKLDGDAEEFIHFMMDAAARMTQLLKDLLLYSQAGRPDKTNMESTPADAALQWTIMNLSPLIHATGATVTYDLLPTVYADQAQLTQLFQNLIGNAIKFRSQAAPLIHVSAAPDGPGMWRFSIRDNGVGIDPEFHERVFGVFKRLHGKDIPGTGIGLSVCRKIVEAHRGRIWIESGEGQGTTVYFTLPQG